MSFRRVVTAIFAVLILALAVVVLLGLALIAFWAGPLTAVAYALAVFGLLYGAVLAYGDRCTRLPTGGRR